MALLMKELRDHLNIIANMIIENIMISFSIYELHLFFYKQSIFDPRPKNCLRFSRKSPQKLFSSCLVDGPITSIV